MPEGVSFQAIHDVVKDGRLGGASSGGLRYDPSRGAALCSGVVSTSGGGGFASFRSSARAWPASAAGVLVTVAAADGQQREYKCTARADDALQVHGAYKCTARDGVGYQAGGLRGRTPEQLG